MMRFYGSNRRWIIKGLAAGLFGFCFVAICVGDTISFCPGPDERYRSPLYRVSSDGGSPAFVYYRENGWKRVPDKNGGDWEDQGALRGCLDERRAPEVGKRFSQWPGDGGRG